MVYRCAFAHYLEGNGVSIRYNVSVSVEHYVLKRRSERYAEGVTDTEVRVTVFGIKRQIYKLMFLTVIGSGIAFGDYCDRTFIYMQRSEYNLGDLVVSGNVGLGAVNVDGTDITIIAPACVGLGAVRRFCGEKCMSVSQTERGKSVVDYYKLAACERGSVIYLGSASRGNGYRTGNYFKHSVSP